MAGVSGGFVDYFYKYFLHHQYDGSDQASQFPSMPDAARPPEEVKSQLV